MKIARLASLMLVAGLAIGLVVVSVASAAPPLFNPTSGVTFTGTSGSGVLTAGKNVVTCKADTSAGNISSATLAGNITVHFLECTGENAAKETCPAMSTGAPLNNLILTKTLHGVLGLVLPKPDTGSDVALVLLPNAQPFVTLLGSCIVETAVEGQVAGLLEPVGSKVKEASLLLLAPGGKQAIKDVDLSTGGLVKPGLTAFGVTGTATEETIETLKFSGEGAEVT